MKAHVARISVLALITLAVAAPAVEANSPPKAVAAATFLPDGTPLANVRLLVGPTPGDTVNWSVDGNGSSDPDGDPLTYHWQCWDGNGNKCLLQLNGIISANVQALFPAGTYTFTLTVKDPSGASSTDTAQVIVLVDNIAPQVIPPEDATISSTETGGARASDSADLNKFLFVDPYAQDPLGLQFFFTALPPQISGVDVDASTLFPAGAATTVTFRFADAFGNVGSATADVYAAALHSGDLLVGGSAVGGADGFHGAIYLIRNGQVSIFCESPPTGTGDPDFWMTPSYVTVDSKGRIVFLASLTFFFGSIQEIGLLRCTAPGQPPEKLAIFPVDATIVPGWPVPFPGQIFQLDGNNQRLTGLHLQRTKKIVIDDAVNGGQPTPVTQESYVFAANPGTIQSFSLRTESLVWVEDEIFPLAVSIGGVHPMDRLPEMFFHSKIESVTLPIPPAGVNVPLPVAKTYVTGGFSSTLRRIHQPLSLDITANISGLGTIQFVFELFGAPLEVGTGVNVLNQSGVTVDDVTIPNGPSGCPAPFPPTIRNHRDPSGAITSSINNVIYEKDAGVVLFSQAGFLPAWMGMVSEALINLDTMDDLPNHYQFQNPATGVCFVFPVVDFEPLTSGYHNDTQTGEPFDYVRTAAAHDGLYATQGFMGRVVKLNQTNKNLTTIANLPGPVGIAAFPPQLGNVQVSALVIRIDSPVDVVVTDTFGRRLGMVNGHAINEFGSQGFDSGPQSHPRFYVVNHPLPGSYAVQSIGTGSGPFTVHAYSVDTGQRRAEHISVTGNALPGAVGKHDFTLDATGVLTFNNAAPVADAGMDQTVTADASGNATVPLDGSGSFDPDGDTLSFAWGIPTGVVSGAVPNVMLPVGVHLLTLTVDDGKGGSNEDTVTITVSAPADATPPVLTLPANFSVTAASSTGTVVTYTASALDAVDGSVAVACAPASGSTFPVGTTAVNCSATDLSANTANGSFTVTVNPPAPAANLLPPVLKIVSRGIYTGQTRFYDLEISNPNSTAQLNMSLFRVTLTTLKGTGSATYNPQLSPPLPIALGDLAAGGVLRIRFYVDVPAGVLLFRISEGGLYYDASGKRHDFSGIHYDD